jgi:outer membrane lipoprotein-sorting protein
MRRFAIGAVLLVVVVSVFAQMPGFTPFSGDMTSKMSDGKSMNGKVYFTTNKMRMDMNMGGKDAVLINDTAKSTSYMIMPSQKMYMEFHAGQGMRGVPKMSDLKSYDPNNPCAQSPEVTCEKQGSETVNGRSTDKWLMKNKKDSSTSTLWIDKKLHFPVRTVTKDAQMDLTNIQEGEPSASLFEIPTGFRKFDMGAFAGGRPQSQ